MAMVMQHAVDPREDLWNKIGKLDDIKIFNNWVLLAVYKRPEKTNMGLYLPDTVRKEDDYQGKVGLVVKKGPLAFVDDEKTSFNGQNIDLGDWIVLRVSDGWSVEINGVLCRMVQDTHIRMAIPHPDAAF
jgi:co-chaperonin GroES (HSP10)